MTRQTKTKITIRLDNDIVDYFKSNGEGWQTRLNNFLKDYIKLVELEKNVRLWQYLFHQNFGNIIKK